jgi:hypothetical protein
MTTSPMNGRLGGRLTGNKRRVLVALLAVVVVLGTGVAAAVFLPRTIERGIDGGGAIEIRLRGPPVPRRPRRFPRSLR